MESGTAAWVHLFSQFTEEALVFEGLAISLIVAGYAAFWILRKRRFGAAKEQIPSGVVKVYLSQLINEAQLIRSQLFGLLQDGEALPEGMTLPKNLVTAAPTASAASDASASSAANSAERSEQLEALQKKLDAQAKNTEKLLNEKSQLESQLEALKAGGAGSGASADAGEVDDLKKKIKELEERLEEYSVIEDDLANLKRLQQENAELKARLEGEGTGKGAQNDQNAAPKQATESKSKSESEPKNQAERPSAETPAETQSQDTNASGDPGFESLVDQVEESLSTEPASDAQAQTQAQAKPESESASASESAADTEAEPEANLGTEGPSGATTQGDAEEPAFDAKTDASPSATDQNTEGPSMSSAPEAKKPTEKKSEPPSKPSASDDDLLSEFEKMLNM
jgi:hypothetical protein